MAMPSWRCFAAWFGICLLCRMPLIGSAVRGQDLGRGVLAGSLIRMGWKRASAELAAGEPIIIWILGFSSSCDHGCRSIAGPLVDIGQIREEDAAAVRLDGSDRPIGPSSELGRTAVPWRRWSTGFQCSGGVLKCGVPAAELPVDRTGCARISSGLSWVHG
ncbi:hypothetical protein ACLOJK_008031 [Asimina triloba]